MKHQVGEFATGGEGGAKAVGSRCRPRDGRNNRRRAEQPKEKTPTDHPLLRLMSPVRRGLPSARALAVAIAVPTGTPRASMAVAILAAFVAAFPFRL